MKTQVDEVGGVFFEAALPPLHEQHYPRYREALASRFLETSR